MRLALTISCLCISFIAPHAVAATPAPAIRSFPVPCSQLQTTATDYLQEKGFDLSPDATCPQCLTGKTNRTRDTRGHSITAQTALHRYMDTSRDGKDVFGAWYVHRQLATTAHLGLHSSTPSTCTATMLFSYSWYAVEFLVVVPFDGDWASRPSNLRLEKEYLHAISDKLNSSPDKTR